LLKEINDPMRAFERKLITEWRRLGLPASDEAVIVAVSGGADSLSLLLAVDELRRSKKLHVRVIAAHFNHHLRGEESDADENFVRFTCSQNDIELAIGHSGIRHTSNIEQAARIERYAFLQSTAEDLKAAIVLTAHTIDDQAETFLLNLIRGSGVQGLSGIRPVRRLSAADSTIELVRPLLSWARRSDTENYCREVGVEYRSDTMNEDESFTRVRIRKILLPLLSDFNPKIVERLADTTRLLREGDRTETVVTAEPLKLTDLRALSDAESSQLLRAWLAVNRGDNRQIELKHIDAIRRLVNSRKSGRTVELPGGSTVVKQDGKLVFSDKLVEKKG
jgi:tRNA(Ile)-lysidine synthase